MRYEYLLIIGLLFITPTILAGSCITTINCGGDTLIDSQQLCDFNFNVPSDYNRVYIEVQQGGGITSSRNLDFTVDANNTPISLWVDYKNMPLYIVCSGSDDDFEKTEFIEMVTIGTDENYSKIPIRSSYDVHDSKEPVYLVLGGLALVLGLYGMIKVVMAFFK